MRGGEGIIEKWIGPTSLSEKSQVAEEGVRVYPLNKTGELGGGQENTQKCRKTGNLSQWGERSHYTSYKNIRDAYSWVTYITRPEK